MTMLRELGKVSAGFENATRGREFAAVARYLMLGQGNFGNTLYEAKAERASERIVEGIKAAVAAGTTGSGTFAAPLAYAELADAFLSSLRNVGVFDAALPFAKQIPLNTQIAVTTVGATAASISEASAKIISRLTLAASTLQIRKAVCILIASNELLRASPVASRLFSEELQKGIAAETDAEFLDVISTGITPTSSSGSNASAIAADMGALLGTINIGVGSKVFIAMNPNDAKHFAIQIGTTGERAFPSLTISGGDYAGCTVIATEALSGSIIGFDASQLAMANNGIELDASNQAAIQMDSVPDSPVAASTLETSFWQMNLTGLRATRYWGTERLRTNAVAVISNVSWGSANSPA